MPWFSRKNTLLLHIFKWQYCLVENMNKSLVGIALSGRPSAMKEFLRFLSCAIERAPRRTWGLKQSAFGVGIFSFSDAFRTFSPWYRRILM